MIIPLFLLQRPDKIFERSGFDQTFEKLMEGFVFSGPRQQIITQDCAGFWLVYKAHPPVHIGGYVPLDATQ